MDRELTKMDVKILEVMWREQKPMSYSQIVEAEPTLNANTVQAQLRKMLKKEWIRVADIGYSGTVLCRSYEPVYTKEEMLTSNYIKELSQLGKHPVASALVCRLLDMEGSKAKKKKEIEELEKMLEEYKKGI